MGTFCVGIVFSLQAASCFLFKSKLKHSTQKRIIYKKEKMSAPMCLLWATASSSRLHSNNQDEQSIH